MKITPAETKLQENEDLYKRLNKSIEKKIVSKEKELKDIDKIYDQRKVQANQSGEEEFAQSVGRNQQRIISESAVFEEKIQNYKDKLKETQDSVAREEAVLKMNGKEKNEAIKLQMHDNHEETFANARANQEQVQSDTRNLINEIANKSKIDKTTMEGNAQYEMNALSTEINQKALNNEKNYRSKLEDDVRLHTVEVNRQKDELKKMMINDAERNKRLADEKNRVATAQLTFQDKHQQNMMTQKDQDFKIRYEKMSQDHTEILKTLSEKFEADVRKVVEKTSSEKKTIEEKSSDPFYRVETLKPKMVEDQKDVTVSINVPEYEKENVILSAQGRSIKIAVARKFSDIVTGDDGSLNRATKSELYSREFNAKDLLNPREITQTYADGVLTYKIKKA